MTTYRQAIQSQQHALQKVYDNAEGLRDAATEEEKKSWNILRGLLDTAISTMYSLDNSVRPGRPEQTLLGNYIINSIYIVNEN